ncbi:hypothetical protein EI983_10420 [Roseovarius faecimaris]|uniref:Alpha-L-glutamate ligase-related protein ATP-grasp domain-containing protein n=1 Tax=Roseovarius faecimaris TaxID=2494550 RepID=A0A6I6IR11_9RHOB|nr:sugar-transfer associated ATP-grasp domain-containing protein [Roseovarius faecimaris]QGX98662.1 hypothetical protein EI983_10420 [Roseovarius faecimaris]
MHAARNSGKSVFQIQREFRQMAKSDSRINMVEYIRFGLYRSENFTDEERAAYISNDLHWEITHRCNNRGWSAVAEDKALAGLMLSSGGVPVPDSIAVIDTTARTFPGLRKISSADALRDLLQNEEGSVFGKIVDGMVSFGAFRIDHADDTHLHCAGQPPMTYDHFFEAFVAGHSYLLQRTLTNHSHFAPYCSALATVRMVNMVRADGVFCPIAIIKLPQGENIADAFWRPGNLACEVDVQTGEILTVAERTGLEVSFHDDHPSVPGLKGLTLPHWDRLIEVNAQAARLFAPMPYQSTDIAITEEGPVIVELNYGGGFDLPQYASGRGMLTPDVRAFFEGNGYVFGGAAKKKGWFGR